MSAVRLVRLDQVLSAIPKPPLSTFAECSLDAKDCLILCAGFEDRAVEVLDKVSAATPGGFGVVLIEYLPAIVDNKASMLGAKLQRCGGKITRLVYDRENPAGFAVTAVKSCAAYTGRLVIDISAMSRLLIVQLLVELKNHPGLLERSVILYTEAKEYPPTGEEVRRLLAERRENPALAIHLLSSGVFEITVVPELSSSSIAGEQTRLIAFPSFNAEQLTAIRAELQPSRLVLFHGVPPDPKNSWRQDAIKQLNETYELVCEEISVSTLDYRQTLEQLLLIYDNHAERDRIVVCPTGSKMQTVSVGLFRAFLEDVQIVYPTPQRFTSTNYTKGIGQSYMLDLAFFAQVK